jgi:hypothetical protein
MEGFMPESGTHAAQFILLLLLLLVAVFQMDLSEIRLIAAIDLQSSEPRESTPCVSNP